MVKIDSRRREKRLKRLEEYLAKNACDYFLTSLEHEIYYFTGAAVEGHFLYGGGYDLLFTSPLYYEDAARLSLSSGVECLKNNYQKEFKSRLKDIQKARFLISNQESLLTYIYIKRSGHKVKIAPTQALRAVKDREEINAVKKAYEIIEKAVTESLLTVREGITELDLKAEIVYRIRKEGAESDSFEHIVVFGEKSSVPHAKSGTRKLKKGDLILIDAGARFMGYCSDITRCFTFGNAPEELKKNYRYLKEAQEAAEASLSLNPAAKKADKAARRVLKKYDLAEYFTHSLGHGLGLEIHEAPYLSVRSSDMIEDGMIFTIEPGLYFSGKYGLRLEDGYYFSKKPVKLSKLSQELIIL